MNWIAGDQDLGKLDNWGFRVLNTLILSVVVAVTTSTQIVAVSVCCGDILLKLLRILLYSQPTRFLSLMSKWRVLVTKKK